MSRSYDLVILDFDGVLADSAPWILRNFDDLSRRYGFRRVDEAEIERLRGLPNREIIRSLGVPGWRLPAIARDIRRRIASEADQIPLFAGTTMLLEQLARQGTLSAVVSSNAEANVRRILGPAAAAGVTLYACGAALFGKAPIFRRVARSLGVAADRVICVGDETRDIEAARKAGFASCAVTWGYAKAAVLEAERPTHVAHDFETLVRLIAA